MSKKIKQLAEFMSELHSQNYALTFAEKNFRVIENDRRIHDILEAVKRKFSQTIGFQEGRQRVDILALLLSEKLEEVV